MKSLSLLDTSTLSLDSPLKHETEDAIPTRMNDASPSRTESPEATLVSDRIDSDTLTRSFVSQNYNHRLDGDSPSVDPLRTRSPAKSKGRSQISHRSRRSYESKKRRKPTSDHSVGTSLSASTPHRSSTPWSLRRASDTTPSSCGFKLHPADPPRPPREGQEWVWFPEGYWAERERPDATGSKQMPGFSKWWNRSPERSRHSPQIDTISNTPDKPDLPKSKVDSPGSKRPSSFPSRRASEHVTESRQKGIYGFNFSEEERPYTNFPASPREGLYCRAKRNIKEQILQRPRTVEYTLYLLGVKANLVKDIDDFPLAFKEGLASRTTMLLEGTSSYFERAQNKRNHLQSDQMSTTTTLQSTPDGRLHRRFGLAPWHRRNSQDSVLSVSSSVRKLLMGKPPVATPDLEKSYPGKDGNRYRRGMKTRT